MNVGDLLQEIAERGITLTCGKTETEDHLNAKPTSAVTPELVIRIKEHKANIIQILREDEELRRTGVIQSGRQVFELAHVHFGLNGK